MRPDSSGRPIIHQNTGLFPILGKTIASLRHSTSLLSQNALHQLHDMHLEDCVSDHITV